MDEKNKNLNPGNIKAGGNVYIGDIYGAPQEQGIPKFLPHKPFNAPVFIGRDQMLERIQGRLFGKDGAFLLLMNGEGGIGKTTLAAKYWYAQEETYRHLAWLYVDEGLEDAMLSMAETLQVTLDPQQTQDQHLQRVLQQMANLPAPSLLILDNANDKNALLNNYKWLHTLNGFHVLITTRVNEVENMPAIKVNTLKPDDALELFKRHYPKCKKEETPLLKSILKAVGYNTLVIEILAKNLKALNTFQKNYSLENLLEDLRQKGLLDIKGKAIHTPWGGPKLKTASPRDIIRAMYDIIDLEVEEIHLLKHFAIIPPDNIPYELFYQLLQPEDNSAFDEQLKKLIDKGWIEFSEKEERSFFKISPVIQSIVQDDFKEFLYLDCVDMINYLGKRLEEDNFWNPEIKSKDRQELAQVAEHVSLVIQVRQTEMAYLAFRLGDYYQKTGNISKSTEKFQWAAQIYEPKKDKGNYAACLSRLGDLHKTLGNLDEALRFFQERQRLGEELYRDYPNQVGFKNGLAVSYWKLGYYYQAIQDKNQSCSFFKKAERLWAELC